MSHDSDQMFQRSQVSRIALLCQKSKVAQSVISEWVISDQWQGHLLSCLWTAKKDQQIPARVTPPLSGINIPPLVHGEAGLCSLQSPCVNYRGIKYTPGQSYCKICTLCSVHWWRLLEEGHWPSLIWQQNVTQDKMSMDEMSAAAEKELSKVLGWVEPILTMPGLVAKPFPKCIY